MDRFFRVVTKLEIDSGDVQKELTSARKSTEGFDRAVNKSKVSLASAGQGMRNLGSSLSRLSPVLGAVVSSIGVMITRLGALRAGMAATSATGRILRGVLRTLGTALTGGLVAIAAFFTQTQRGLDSLSVLGAGLQSIISNIVDAFSAAGEQFVQGNFQAGIKAFSDGLGQIKDDLGEAARVQRVFNQLRDEELALSVRSARRQTEINRLRLVAEDEFTATIQERIDAEQKAADINTEDIADRLAQQQKLIDTIKSEQALSENLFSDNQALAEAEIKLQNIQQEGDRLARRLITRLAALYRLLKTDVDVAAGSISDLTAKLKEQETVLASTDPSSGAFDNAREQAARLKADLENAQNQLNNVLLKVLVEPTVVGGEELQPGDLVPNLLTDDEIEVRLRATVDPESGQSFIDSINDQFAGGDLAFGQAISSLRQFRATYEALLNLPDGQRQFQDNGLLAAIDAAISDVGNLQSERILENLSAINGFAQSVLSGLISSTQEQIQDFNAAVQNQEERIRSLRNTTLDANADIVASEEAKLNNILAQRRRFAGAARALASAQFISQITLAIAQAAAQGGPLGIVGIFTLLGAVTEAINQARQLAIFHGGTEFAEPGQQTGPRRNRMSVVHKSDEFYALMRRGERVLDVEDNKKLGGMSTDELIHRALNYNIGGAVVTMVDKYNQVVAINTGRTVKLLENVNGLLQEQANGGTRKIRRSRKRKHREHISRIKNRYA